MLLLSCIVFVAAYSLLIGTIVSVGLIRQKQKERKYVGGQIQLDEVVVLIPFRNEAHRISGLLNSIKKLNKHPRSFVFIDDHSSDGTAELVTTALEGIDHSILSLPEDVTGKKRALRFATKHTSSTWILTMDADVTLEAGYFDHLSQLGEADMYILPAIMVPVKTYEHFYAIDLYLVNAINAGLAGIARPIVASGANLLYRRSTFQLVDNLLSHGHSASGDDTYLLRDFRLNRTDVRMITDPKLAVFTETPQSLREFVDQRLRWVGKTGNMKDFLSTVLTVVQIVLTAGFMAILVAGFVAQNYALVAAIAGLKIAVDMSLFYGFFSRTKCLKSWWFIPVYEVIFPLYTLMMLVLVFTYRPKWKGRAIYEAKK